MKWLVFLGFVVPQAALAQDWVGDWAVNPDKVCANADRIGSQPEAPIRFTETEVLGYENTCQIVEATPLGQVNAYLISMSCRSEGQTFQETTVVMIDTLNTMWRWYGSGDPLRFRRCPHDIK